MELVQIYFKHYNNIIIITGTGTNLNNFDAFFF